MLVGIEKALDDFIQSLKKEYDKTEGRMIFVSVFSAAFLQGALYVGKIDLHGDEKNTIANRTIVVRSDFNQLPEFES